MSTTTRHPTTVAAGARRAMNLAAALCAAGTLLLGGLWLSDRARQWEVPRWRSDRFVSLRAWPGEPTRGRALWLVPFNPRCGRCRAALPRLHALWAGGVRDGRLAALLVDTPGRPDAATLDAMPPVPVWWDRDGIWRRRWGHRLYGEVMEFDAAGRLVRTVSSEALLRRGWPREDASHDAPGERQEEGT